MDLTSLFHNYINNITPSQELQSQYKFKIKDDKVFYLMESLYEIKKLKKLFKNYFKINDKVLNISEFVDTFIKQKNEFLNNMSVYMNSTQSNNSRKDNYLNKHSKVVVLEMTSLLKHRLDELLSGYKVLKQKISKKQSINNKYWENKISYILEKEEIKRNKKANTNKNMNRNEDKDVNLIEAEKCNNINKASEVMIEPPKEKWVLQYLPQENKSTDEISNILSELSELVKSFSQKVYFHNEMTQNSK